MKNMKKLMSMAMALLAVGVMSLTGCTKNEAAPAGGKAALKEENGVQTCLDTESSPFDDCVVHVVVDKSAGTVTFTKATKDGQDTQEYYRFTPAEHMLEQYYYVSMMGTGFYYYYDTDLGEMVRMENKDHEDNTASAKENGRFDGAAEQIKKDAEMLQKYFESTYGMSIADAVK